MHPAPSEAVELSVVVPVFDEEGSLGALLPEIEAAARAVTEDYEVVFVDDGSRDRSPEILGRFARENPRVVVYRLDRNHGLTSALHAGFRRARGRLIASLDADLQNDPADLPRLVAALAEGADLACGWRRDRKDPWLKRASSRIANAWRNRRTRSSIHDVTCPLKVFRREVREEFYPFNGIHRFFPTLAEIAGYRVVEIPVSHRARLHGTSKYGVWNRLFRGLRDLGAVRWMQDRRLCYRAERVQAADAAEAQR